MKKFENPLHYATNDEVDTTTGVHINAFRHLYQMAKGLDSLLGFDEAVSITESHWPN